jgi:predicted permease
MTAPNPLRRLARSLFGGSRRERELDEEIRSHLEAAEAHHRERGLSAEEAHRAALLDFGGVDSAKEGVREAWALARLKEIGRDARYAVRGFRKHFAYAATVVLTLALAIGASGAIFNALWTIVVRPLPFAHDDRLAVLQLAPNSDAPSVGLSPLEVADFRTASRTLAGIAEYHSMGFTLLGHGEPRRVRTGVVSPNYFSLLGVQPLLGRDFVAADDSPSARPVLLLTHAFWQRELGGDPAIIGADFTMNDRIHTVVGILPPLPAAPEELDVYMPVSACPFRSGEHWSRTRSMRGLVAIARLRDGVDSAAAASDVATVTQRLCGSYPADYPKSLGLAARLVPIRRALTADARPTLWLLAATSVAVLLLVCANLLNLTLARLARREAELAMRTALGGSRARLARQLATEGCVLALAGGALGLVFAAICRGVLTRFLGRLTPRASEMRLDLATVVTVLALSLLVGLVIGLLPALRRAVSLVGALRSDAPTTTAGGGASRLRDALVVLQVASSFVLLIGAGLLLRSLWNLERVAPGYEHPDVLTIHLPQNWTKYAKTEDQVAYKQRLIEQARALPGVESAAFADSYPLAANLPWNRRVAIGRTAPDGNEPGPEADFRVVSPEYFATVGVPLLSGRLFTAADRDVEHAVAVVNAAFARTLLPDREPLGQQVIFSNGTTAWTIVGVVAEVHQRALGEAPKAELYVPLALNGNGDHLLVRAHAARSLMPSLRRAIRAVDPEQPIADIRTLEEARAESLAAPRSTAALLAIAAALALAIAAAGLAGLLAYSLGQRQREFGIRLALGATRRDIARLVIGRTGALVGLGALLGLGGALAFTRSLRSMLFGLGSNDPATYAVVAAVLLISAFGACLPALRRAIGTAPSLALRAL